MKSLLPDTEPARSTQLRVSLLGLTTLTMSAALAFGACTTKDPVESFGGGAQTDGGQTGVGTGSVPGAGGAQSGVGGGEPGVGGQTGSGASHSGAGGGEPGVGGGSSGGSSTGGGGNGTGGSAPTFDCGSPPVSQPETFTREALRSAAAECATWHFCQFEGVAGELEDAVRRYEGDRSPEKLAAAQTSWRTAMAVWSHLEVFQFGPLAAADMDVYQGQALRAFIYYWPYAARCKVEEQLASQKYATSGMANVLTTGRGLTALEYLLFYGGSDTTCLAITPTAKTWATLGAAEIANRKVAYAVALADDVHTQAENLSTVFAPNGGNYEQKFVSASGYQDNEQEAMNVLAWALIYIEREVKDWKLGVPAGYTATWPGDPTSPFEAPYAQVATENLRANLRGFRSLFQGCGENGEGVGFDDWLRAVGQASLADDMVAAYENAQSVVDALPPLHQASPAQIDAAYQAVKALTDLLKADFFGAGSALNLKLPATLEGDND